MKSLLPARVKQVLEHHEQKLIIEVKGSGATVKGLEPGGLVEVAVFDFVSDDEQKIESIKQLFNDPQKSISDTIVYIPQHFVLQKKLSLPLATEENLRNVLAFEMDKQTPFSHEQVYFDYKVEERDKIKGEIRVNLVIAQRKTIDNLLDTFKNYGLTVSVIDVWDESVPGNSHMKPIVFNLLPTPQRKKRSTKKGKIYYRLSFLFLALFILVIGLPLMNKQRIIADLEKQISQTKTVAFQVQRIHEDAVALLAQNQFFEQKRKKLPAIIDVLNELTRILPDTTSLTQFNVVGNKLKIHGESTNSSELIGIIEKSIYFNGAKFSSPITRNPKNNKERFLIAVQIGGETQQ